jgi:hypothetical protein
MAEQLHVMLNACDHLALFFTSTISAVMVHTELTMPPPPIPAIARVASSQVMVCPTIQRTNDLDCSSVPRQIHRVASQPRRRPCSSKARPEKPTVRWMHCQPVPSDTVAGSFLDKPWVCHFPPSPSPTTSSSSSDSCPLLGLFGLCSCIAQHALLYYRRLRTRSSPPQWQVLSPFTAFGTPV